jgi:hypothetical protein
LPPNEAGRAVTIVYALTAIVMIALALDWALMRWLKGLRQMEAGAPKVVVLGAESPVLTWLRYGRLPAFRRPAIEWAQVRARLAAPLELAAIGLWAAWVGRAYLDFDPRVWPVGNDFALNVQSYFAWAAFGQCGACALWNGSLNGGLPTLAELLSAIAHPLVLAAIALWGVINGLKATVVMALALAGAAQWWLAKAMRLGRGARLWSAAMAVVGGHLAGRMENGLIEVAFSTASCSLVIAAAVELALTGTRRAAVLFGAMLGLALLAGQGYMQIGLALSVFPALIVFLPDDRFRLRPVWKEYALGGALALLIAAVLLVPFLHFFPNFDKPDDPEFATAQPLEYQPLNLVIRDEAFFGSQALGQIPWPHLYVNYVGWVPILLALLAFRLAPRADRRLLVFFLAAIVLVYLTSSSLTLRFLHAILPPPLAGFTANLRFPSEIASLAAPLVVGLAAWGLDLLLKLNWPRLTLHLPSGAALGVSLVWLALAYPLYGSVLSAYDFGGRWLRTVRIAPDNYRVVPQLKTETPRWVEPPIGDWGLVTIGLEHGLKFTRTYRPWDWRGREFPPVALHTTRDPLDPSTPNYAGRIEYLYLIEYPEVHYAYVDTGAQKIPCRARALGGSIDVDCETGAPGLLVVYENKWSGWTVERDDAPAALGEGPWLSTAAPAGAHHYAFRYRPWDASAGLGLTIFGLGLAAWLWMRAPRSPAGEASAG